MTLTTTPFSLSDKGTRSLQRAARIQKESEAVLVGDEPTLAVPVPEKREKDLAGTGSRQVVGRTWVRLEAFDREAEGQEEGVQREH